MLKTNFKKKSVFSLLGATTPMNDKQMVTICFCYSSILLTELLKSFDEISKKYKDEFAMKIKYNFENRSETESRDINSFLLRDTVLKMTR